MVRERWGSGYSKGGDATPSERREKSWFWIVLFNF